MSISTLVDRVKITVLSAGTGPFLLGPAAGPNRGVEALENGATYSYATEFGANYEAGTGVFLSESGTFVRSPQISSAGGGPVAFPSNIELVFTALAADIVPSGAVFPIVDALGSATNEAPSQRAATEGIENILNGLSAWDLPEETDGDILPSPGSKLPYLSAGVLKIA